MHGLLLVSPSQRLSEYELWRLSEYEFYSRPSRCRLVERASSFRDAGHCACASYMLACLKTQAPEQQAAGTTLMLQTQLDIIFPKHF